MKSRVIYQDEAIIVAYKPSGLPTQTAKVGCEDMVSELKKELVFWQKNSGRRQTPYLGLIHRLDQPVEGLLVFAKTQKAAAALSKQLSEGVLRKQYYAAVCGKVSAKEGELVDYLLKGNDNRAMVVTGAEKQYPEAKKAVLQYKIVDRASGREELFLADIHIDTGRFHQIRAQMSHAGMPLLGDLKYGTEESCKLSRTEGIRNVALCAYKLVLEHPLTGKRMSFEIKPEGLAFDYFSENNFGCDCLY